MRSRINRNKKLKERHNICINSFNYILNKIPIGEIPKGEIGNIRRIKYTRTNRLGGGHSIKIKCKKEIYKNYNTSFFPINNRKKINRINYNNSFFLRN